MWTGVCSLCTYTSTLRVPDRKEHGKRRRSVVQITKKAEDAAPHVKSRIRNATGYSHGLTCIFNYELQTARREASLHEPQVDTSRPAHAPCKGR